MPKQPGRDLTPEGVMATEYSKAKRQLLEKFLQGQLGSRRAAQPIPRRDPTRTIPLSHSQEQVWVHAQLAPHLPLYNEPVTIHYSGALKAAALEQAFNEILRRHEAWRTSFTVVDGHPVQKVHEQLSISLPVIDLTVLPPAQREAKALEIATADAREPLDLAAVPLFRAKLIRVDQEKYRLYLTLCHIIFDGVALYRVLLPELAALYKAYAAGEPSPLPELPIQYPDFACWERRTFTDETFAKEIDYWRKRLQTPLPEAYLPADHRPPRSRTFRGSMYPFKLRAPLMREVRDFSRREGLSVFQVLFGAFAALLQRYSGEERIPIGMVTAGRNRPETERLLGYFLNTVVVPADTSGDPTFRTLVHRARNWTIDAMDHDEVSFEYLVRSLNVPRDPSRNPLFQALFSLEPPLPPLDPEWRLTQMDVDTETTKYDLYLELDDRSDEMLARFHYSTDLFDRETIAHMAVHWKSMLRSGIAKPDQKLSELTLLSPRERRMVLRKCHGRSLVYPHTCIHQLFEQQVERCPDATAVISQGRSISYSDLNKRANQLANLLLGRGIQKECLIGLCVERGLGMIIALLGVLKAGAAYVPLDPRLPDERLRYLLDDAQPALIISDDRSWRPELGSDAIVHDRLDEFARESNSNPQINVSPSNLAYVMYTSGSTGTPKGVSVEHGNVVNLLSSMQQEPGIVASDVLLAVTTLSFDIAGLEIFLPLVSGARVVLADSSDVVDGTRLKQLLHEHQATMMQATPATWRLLLEAGWSASPKLKILCGGETLSTDLAKELVARSASVWNVYGPTETTIWSSIHRVRGEDEETVPIGHPIANTNIYILDSHGNPVPANVVGEIYIGGVGLARGYWKRQQLTDERFVANPLHPGVSRLYRTGDQGRLRSNGEIEYLGRIDTQIKLRGMRIELGEIESVIASHPDVQQAVVIVKGEPEQQKLSAYVVANDASDVSAADLRRYARNKLPEYMIPAEFLRIDEIPLLPSGKVNRAALSQSGMMLLKDEENWVGPRNEVEVRLASIWRELLKVEKVGVNQNFFELGGHSLLVLQMIARIRRNLNVEVPARRVFESPTIAALAEHVAQAVPGVIMRSLFMQHPRSADADAILNQLHRLSAEDAQRLLKAMLEEKEARTQRLSPTD
jgi:amino acid adenylation domain-containing protein